MTTRIEQRIEYYRNKNVRARIIEFLGGDALNPPTCRYIVGGDESGPHFHNPKPITQLESLMNEGLEIGRSLWDGTSLLADFDIEYVNFDHPSEVFTDPERAFGLLQPVANEIERTLNHCNIPALRLLSGRGHHFIWRIRRDSPEFIRLVSLGRGPDSLWRIGDEPHLPEGRRVPADLARAFSGLGLLMEFLAHEIKERAARECTIPVELTALEVGPSSHGREMVSIDLSEYGDPLHMRMIRAAFSSYLKPWQQRWTIAENLLESLPPLFVIPLPDRSWRKGIHAMRNAAAATKAAANCSAIIPDATTGMSRLMNDYETSKIAGFHRWFYSQEPHQPKLWSETYDRVPLDVLPVCARITLEQPNDLLLRPGRIRQLVRVMLALGWHPRHIAGLVHSKYARPYGWTQFEGYDRAARADFYTRLFAGSFAAGYDDLVDFNCVSAQEQGICPYSNCSFNLIDFKQSALNRRAHATLAHRPFNRLLLQSEHH